MKTWWHRRRLAAGASCALVLLVTLTGCGSGELVQGEVEATQVDVGAKIAGRIDSMRVTRGQQVHKGDLLVTLETPEIRAKLAQATSAERAAEAQSRKARVGAREEEVRAAAAQWTRALAASALAESTYRRVARLHRDGVVATQRCDEAETAWTTAHDTERAARAVYDMARTGARVEDREAAAALASQAAGVVSEVDAYLSEARLHAPLDGEVADVVADPGELVSPGYPIVTLVDLDDAWVVFQMREDRLGGVKMGTVMEARFPALGKRTARLRVTFISPLGDYATWRATRETGDFDLKTFEVRARPEEPVPGLRPGMSALVRWPKAR
jgi:HlyD family secretion protein